MERESDLEKQKKTDSTIYWSEANLLIFPSPIFLPTGNSNNNAFYLDSRLYELQSVTQQSVYLHYYKYLGQKKIWKSENKNEIWHRLMILLKSKTTHWHCYFHLGKGVHVSSKNILETGVSRLGSESLGLIFLLHVLTWAWPTQSLNALVHVEGLGEQGHGGSNKFLFMAILAAETPGLFFTANWVPGE